MKYLIQFISLYFIVILSLLSFYVNTNSKHAERLNYTFRELDGIAYIQTIHHLATDLIHLNNIQIQKYPKEEVDFIKKDIKGDIDAIFEMQKVLINFQNDEFKQNLQKIQEFAYNHEDFYHFLDSINHENYRIGDVSHLLFDEDRETHFLSSLITHYMPEYLISLSISDSLVQKFYYSGELAKESKNLYIEQNKLVYLSSKEIEEILSLLSPSVQVDELHYSLEKIKENLLHLNEIKGSQSIWGLNSKQVANYISVSSDVIKLSQNLNTQYIDILFSNLNTRQNSLEKMILTYKVIAILTFILITIISIYFYKIKRSDLRKEEEIKKINSELDELVLFSKSDRDGNITHISSALLKVSGFTRDEVLGKNHRIFKSTDNDPAIYDDMWKTISAKKVWQGELKNSTKNGTSYWIRLTIVPNLDDNETILSYSAHRTNITNLKNLELEKIKSQEALDFKSKFLSNMSHEIRTPLNGIIGLTHVALKNCSEPTQKNIIDNIASSSEILLGIINDILDISKIEAGKMSIEKVDFNLKTLLNTVNNINLTNINEKDISLRIDYHDIDNFNFIGDSLRITQILNNLISNAIKFTSSGEIVIDVSRKENSSLLFKVIDSGIGIKEDQLPFLFKDFSQADMSTSRKYGGTGLGLSISKKLVQLMGGDIWVKSIYTQGSTFNFSLPLKNSLKMLEKVKEDTITLEALKEKVNKLEAIKVLVAEDNKMNQMVLSMLLEDSSITLDFALDGEEALKKFKINQYNFIFMDIQMPNMNGYESSEAIRKLDKNIPIIALSANVKKEDKEKAIDAGMNDYLTKPIELEELYYILIKYS